jgi:hypothetical protein
MLDGQTITIIIALVSFAVGGVWKLSRVESALRADITAAKDEVEEKQSQHSREFGETIAALRQKIADVELYASNHYVRRDGFYKVQEQFTADLRALGDRIEARFVRLEAKIDNQP